MRPHGVGVGEVRADEHVPLARQRRRDLFGAVAARAVVHRDAVAGAANARATAAPMPRDAPVTRIARLMAAMVRALSSRPDEALRLLGHVPHPPPRRPPVRQRLQGAARGRPRSRGRDLLRAALLPDALANRTSGRQAAKRLTGSSTVPVLELDDGTAVFDSKRIVAWARANPRRYGALTTEPP